MTGVGEPAGLGEVPAWLRPLAAAARQLRPGELSRFLPPEDGSGRASAVLILLTQTSEGPCVLLIQRAADLRTHAGQVAFPGGAVDVTDPSHISAALREAEEEVGVDPSSVHVIAELPPIFLPPSGFVVTPVLAWWTQAHPVSAVDAGEVAEVALVPVAELSDPRNRFAVTHPSGWVGPGFEARGLFVWGFTAGLVDRLLVLGGWAQPWDETRRRPLPQEMSGRPASPPRG
ncbi:MAG TPA: CoA pyrophosphatase [Jatrophihabitantaceae bacterium]|jgi:8-oxo-dGTP pyrophosphatase MutT (NUDIX family)|nr:CoA pyrophosphatase [Jatrophihabitantaceae bacterium]